MRFVKFVIILLFVTFQSKLMAMEYDGIVGFGVDFGGDTLVRANFSDGTSVETSSHQGATYAGGLLFRWENNVELQTLFGIKPEGLGPRSQGYSFFRYPAEVMGFYRLGRFRFGSGINYHFRAELVCDSSAISPACTRGSRVDSTVGWVMEYSYVLKRVWFERSTIGARYTTIKYHSDFLNKDVTALGAGFFLTVAF
jgi:hypothetical protein